MTTTTDWAAITEAVTADAEHLKTLTTHGAIYAWADDHHLTGPQFGAVKHQLRKIGVDYDAIRNRVNQQRDQARGELVAAATGDGVAVIRLSAAGCDPVDERRGTYAVCDAAGTAVWYGNFHERDVHYHQGDQVSADTSAAHKAIYLADQARQHINADVARLELTITNPHVDTDQLIREATSRRVLLDITINDSPANPPAAANWCMEDGWQNWHEIDLAGIVTTPDTAHREVGQ